MKVWSILAISGLASAFDAQKKYGHLGDKVEEMLETFLKKEVGHNQGFDADRMNQISERYQV